MTYFLDAMPQVHGVPSDKVKLADLRTDARRPPLWDDGSDVQIDEAVHIEPDWVTDCDGAAQPAPDFEVDQRISW